MIKRPETYTIHDIFYERYEDENYDILQSYNKKYKTTVTLLFPKGEEKNDEFQKQITFDD